MKLKLQEAINHYNEHLEPGEAPMTQRRLAEAVGLTEGMVSKHANGRFLPKLPVVERYSQVLRTSISALLSDASDLQGDAGNGRYRLDDLLADPEEAVNKRAASLKKRGAA